MKTVLALLTLFVFVSTPAIPTPCKDMHCAYKLSYRTNPYACVDERTYAHCMACIDNKATACRVGVQNDCGLSDLEAKDECATINYLSTRICAGDFQ